MVLLHYRVTPGFGAVAVEPAPSVPRAAEVAASAAEPARSEDCGAAEPALAA